MKLLVVLGEGGHSKEMLALVDLLGDRYAYAYLLTHEDNLSAGKIRTAGARYRVARPRGKSGSWALAVLRTLLCAAQSLVALLRARPDAIVHCGPAVALPVSVWAKLLRKPVIFVETGSRVHRLSLTGRLMRPLADLYFVQWPQLLGVYPQAIYAGRLF